MNGCDIVWPSPIGSGRFSYATASRRRGTKRWRGTVTIASITAWLRRGRPVAPPVSRATAAISATMRARCSACRAGVVDGPACATARSKRTEIANPAATFMSSNPRIPGAARSTSRGGGGAGAAGSDAAPHAVVDVVLHPLPETVLLGERRIGLHLRPPALHDVVLHGPQAHAVSLHQLPPVVADLRARIDQADGDVLRKIVERAQIDPLVRGR